MKKPNFQCGLLDTPACERLGRKGVGVKNRKNGGGHDRFELICVGGQEASRHGTDKTRKDEQEPQVHWAGKDTADREKLGKSAQKTHRYGKLC